MTEMTRENEEILRDFWNSLNGWFNNAYGTHMYNTLSDDVVIQYTVRPVEGIWYIQSTIGKRPDDFSTAPKKLQEAMVDLIHYHPVDMDLDEAKTFIINRTNKLLLKLVRFID